MVLKILFDPVFWVIVVIGFPIVVYIAHGLATGDWSVPTSPGCEGCESSCESCDDSPCNDCGGCQSSCQSYCQSDQYRSCGGCHFCNACLVAECG